MLSTLQTGGGFHDADSQRACWPEWLRAWKPARCDRDPVIFWDLPEQSVQPDVLRRVQVSVENIRKVCWRSADALQGKEWERVNHQTQLELSLQSRVSLRERLIELGHACVKLENWGIAKLRAKNSESAGVAAPATTFKNLAGGSVGGAQAVEGTRKAGEAPVDSAMLMHVYQ